MDGHVLPGVDRKTGRPGMEMWRILVLGVVRQGLGCGFDRLRELANEHNTLRRFPVRADVWDRHRHGYQTLADNVSLLRPELLAAVSGLVVESGHAAAGKKPGAPLRGRCDSFVAGTGVHCPTGVSLLWDAVRRLLRETGRAEEESGTPGWRQWKHLTRQVLRLFHRVRRTRRARPEHVEAYLARCLDLAARAEAALPELAAHGAEAWETVGIEHYTAHARRQTDLTDHRLLRGEAAPRAEKVFPVFEPHTRWIAKGKAGRPVELGVPVCVLEDRHGFILRHEIMREGAQARFPDLRMVSSGRGFHSPENRVRLGALPGCNALPKKGYLNRAESSPPFTGAPEQPSSISPTIRPRPWRWPTG